MKVEGLSAYASPEEVWTSLFETLCERIGPCFARSETRAGVSAYLRGLLSPIERKNGWQLAEEAGLATPYTMQFLLNRAKWDSDAVREQLQGYVRERMAGAGADGMLVIDETGFLKKGKKSVGVQRQYSGTAGRIENCQIGVFLTYASQGEHTLVDRELYLPKSWTQEPERCRAAHVPEAVVFATKPELAARMLWRTLDAGLAARPVTGDTVYGSHRPLRAGLEARSQAYALAVSCQEQVEVQGERKRVDRIADGLEPDQWQRLSVGDGSKGPREFDWACVELSKPEQEGWQRLSVGDGSKGPREFDWACVELSKPEQEGWQRFLLVRRSLVVGEKPAERAYVLVFAPGGTTLAEMATAIGTRLTVEQCFQEGKGEVGLDHYEVRSWHGWYRHITLCMLAHAFLVVLRIESQRLLPQTEPPLEKTWEPSMSLSIFKRQRGLLCP